MLLCLPASAQVIDWQPVFNDKPVPPKEAMQVAAAVPQQPLAVPERPRRVLVYSATSGYRHSAIPIGQLALDTMGQQTGAYTAVISDDPVHFEPEALAAFDAVVLLNAGNDFFMPTDWKRKSLRDQFTDAQWESLKQRQERLLGNLIAYVHGGGGLVGIHHTAGGCPDHPAFGETLGATFWWHPWSAKQTTLLVVEDSEHALISPVFEGLAEMEIQEELYEFREEPFPRDRVRVLLRVDPNRSDPNPKWPRRRSDDDYPVAWVQAVGQGRVFYSSLGHNHDMYWNPLVLNHFLAGVQFAVGDLAADTTPSSELK